MNTNSDLLSDLFMGKTKDDLTSKTVSPDPRMVEAVISQALKKSSKLRVALFDISDSNSAREYEDLRNNPMCKPIDRQGNWSTDEERKAEGMWKHTTYKIFMEYLEIDDKSLIVFFKSLLKNNPYITPYQLRGVIENSFPGIAKTSPEFMEYLEDLIKNPVKRDTPKEEEKIVVPQRNSVIHQSYDNMSDKEFEAEMNRKQAISGKINLAELDSLEDKDSPQDELQTEMQEVLTEAFTAPEPVPGDTVIAGKEGDYPVGKDTHSESTSPNKPARKAVGKKLPK